MDTRRKKRGFTLTEMLVVISIIGIGAAMTLALGAGFVTGNTLAQATRMTQAYLMEARSRAIATRQYTSVVLYRFDNLAVMVDRLWEPVGQALAIPDPCFYFIYHGDDILAAGDWYNRIAPKYDILVLTFEAGGAVIKNFPQAYRERTTRCGAIFINVLNPLEWRAVGGTIASDDGDTIVAKGAWGPYTSKGWCVIGGELVSYQGKKSQGGGYIEFQSIQRNVLGSGDKGPLAGKPVLPAGYCGTLMVIGATGHVVTVCL